MNFDRLSLASYWFFDVRTYVRSEAEEQTLLENWEPFKECRDCPEMNFISKGVTAVADLCVEALINIKNSLSGMST